MKRKTLARAVAIVVLGLGIVWAIANRDAVDGAAVEAWLGSLGPWAGPAYIAAYVVGTVLFIPGSVLTLAGGAVFGPATGTVLTIVGATLGATAAFLFARLTGGAWVARRLGGRLADLVEGVEEEGWKFVAFVRLVPLFPYNVLNYALGLTRISLGQYVVASAICMAPGAVALNYLGYAGRAAMTGDGTSAAIHAGLIGIGVLATAVFVLPRVAGWLRGID